MKISISNNLHSLQSIQIFNEFVGDFLQIAVLCFIAAASAAPNLGYSSTYPVAAVAAAPVHTYAAHAAVPVSYGVRSAYAPTAYTASAYAPSAYHASAYAAPHAYSYGSAYPAAYSYGSYGYNGVY